MAHSYEYLVCLSQAGKVTFVNDDWQGGVTGRQNVPEVRQQMYDSCPDLTTFLRQAGSEGWELVAAYAVQHASAVQEKLILKRAR